MGGDKVSSVQLLEERSVLFKNLAGFQKHHRVPAKVSSSDRRFLVELAESEVDDDLQAMFSALRKAYGLKRKELSVSGPVDGGGAISTPFFQYIIQIEQDEEQPSRCVWRRAIADISEPARVFAGPFDQVFGKQFGILEVVMKQPLDLETIVDHIEDADLDHVKLDYDKDLTWCEVQLIDLLASVVLRDGTIQVVSKQEASPQQLLEMFLEVQNQFMSTLNMGDVPFLSAQ